MWTKSFSRYTHILLVSAAVIIGAQISISLFESDFRVSIGIFGIFMSLILFGKYPILPVTVISALCVFFSRTLMHWLRFGSWNPQNYFPEMFFYLVYGILFFLYCRKNDYELSMYNRTADPYGYGRFFFSVPGRRPSGCASAYCTCGSFPVLSQPLQVQSPEC